MIAVNESSRNSMVCLFKTLRGFVGGNTEPVDWNSRAHNLDENLEALGWRRVMDWQPVPGQPGAVWAQVLPL